MTRTTALWGAAFSLGLLWGSLAYAQQPAPASAANDTLTTTGEEVQPTTGGDGPTEMMETEQEVRRSRRDGRTLAYYFALGLGSSVNYLPEDFRDSYDPSFGLRLGGGVGLSDLRIGISFAYNFFLSNEPTTIFPNDLNILTLFGELKYIPIGKTVRPYILVAGGLYRQWVVNTDYTESVLGYGGGAGVELEIDKSRHIYVEGRYIQGRTRETQERANTEIIPFGLGMIWLF